MENESLEVTWNFILQVKSALQNRTQPTWFISVTLPGDAPAIHFDRLPDGDPGSVIIDFEGGNNLGDAHLVAKGPFSLGIEENRVFDKEQVDFLSLYLPYALLPLFSAKHQKCYAISHFAQTLDGRIASSTGNSKWIGNKENLANPVKNEYECELGVVIHFPGFVIDQAGLSQPGSGLALHERRLVAMCAG